MPTVLLTIHQEWANAILDGTKNWEYRRIPPKTQNGSRVVMYATGCQAIIGEFIISGILKEPLDRLIAHTVKETPHNVDDIYSYFSGLEIGSALRVSHPRRYRNSIPFKRIKEEVPGFVPPQSFRYLKSEERVLCRTSRFGTNSSLGR